MLQEIIMEVVEERISERMSRSWWVLLLRGLVAILFGVLTWFRPGITLAALVILFGAYALVDGILDAWTAIAGRKQHEYWWATLLSGLVGIFIGILTLARPGITALPLLFYIALWAIARGVLEIVAALRLRKEIKNEWLLVLAGVASVLFGAILIARPGTGALAVIWLIGVYAFAFGILLVMLAFKARRFGQRLAHA